MLEDARQITDIIKRYNWKSKKNLKILKINFIHLDIHVYHQNIGMIEMSLKALKMSFLKVCKYFSK